MRRERLGGNRGAQPRSRGSGVRRGERAVAEVPRKNLADCRIETGVRDPGDILGQIPRLARDGDRFDLIYFDPPYFEGLYDKALAAVAGSGLLAPGGLMTVNHFKKVAVPVAAGALARVRTVRHGDSALSFYAWQEPADAGS